MCRAPGSQQEHYIPLYKTRYKTANVSKFTQPEPEKRHNPDSARQDLALQGTLRVVTSAKSCYFSFDIFVYCVYVLFVFMLFFCSMIFVSTFLLRC